MSLANEKAFKYEKEIVWLEDLNNYPWVRESSTDFLTKQGITESRKLDIESAYTNKIIGYANLEDNTPHDFIDPETGNKHYKRRIFTVRYDDYENYQGRNSYPLEAVDPIYVEPKRPSISSKALLN